MIDKHVKRKRAKRLVIEVPDITHQIIKEHAETHNRTIKNWVLMAIIERLEKEKSSYLGKINETTRIY